MIKTSSEIVPQQSILRALPALPIYRPDLSGNEKKYVNECLDTTWISSIGSFVDRFEASFRQATGAAHAHTVSNGTVALHLALHCLDIGPGDEVIVPAFTYIASVNTIAQTGAKPVFVDCRPEDWLIDVEDVARKITPRTKAIMPVHLYGAVCDMSALGALASSHKLKLIEDCAEALGSSINGQHVGRFGDVGTFSFFGNKTVTTGEGGMVIAADDELAARLKLVKGQGQSPTRRYWHVELGFNYRMTNICAAIGLAQMERLDAILTRKREIAALYRRLTAGMAAEYQQLREGAASSDWLVSLLLPRGTDRDGVMSFLKDNSIETRPVFYCAHQMPMFLTGETFAIAEDVAARGISLPSYPGLSDQDVERVVDTLHRGIKKFGAA
ncbi:DegT/DnrJ/EryC1/StrS aminotransferase family protein [Tardiphaga sp. P9-11]|uniref:DegT/DnrJ/EryC1/StrS family aminotransferase n=1 Tax=Tardiphaga sp. P9-11 TaxID=2024614 RepID=UPI0011F1B03A|nr:DegT/DnrJ/EryC1/StrS aminotransferase family protein [Tardiphaga sp. P9-11]KAA0073021.1 DegT/DnrJ/EryC1/StrS aminotransferase family protein [Tardiphaga sp. P9-11]